METFIEMLIILGVSTFVISGITSYAAVVFLFSFVYKLNLRVKELERKVS